MFRGRGQPSFDGVSPYAQTTHDLLKGFDVLGDRRRDLRERLSGFGSPVLARPTVNG
ncbi:hypothetical protein FHU29_001361 [Hoyosella altamirensis]|uniref:Uncharacterized protein n=1 Tax=Hoyosella altamirensis TaxID=616997 RepID=A0A839RKL2_9ACTN|nr:hypothetical protein [Hoyosella altamirensis]